MDSRSDLSKQPEKNGGNVILYVLVSFHTGDVFCTLGRLFVRSGFRLFSARLAVHSFAVYSVLGSYANFNGNECDSCASVRYNSLFISLLLFAKVQKTTT